MKKEIISTLEMEIALMDWIGFLDHIIVPNVYWSFFRHEVDILALTSSGYATEYEIKISKSDLKKDLEKRMQHRSKMIKYLYFATPDTLEDYALEIIPANAGLVTVTSKKLIINGGFYSKPNLYVKEVRKATINPDHRKWTQEEMNKLSRLGVIRIYGLKKNLLKAIKGEKTYEQFEEENDRQL